MTGSRIFQIVLIGIVCFSGYYLLVNQEQDVIQVAPNVELPMFTGRHVTNTNYDLDGIRNYKISSLKLDHYAQSGDTLFDNLIMYVYREGTTEEWQVVSDKAVLDKNNHLTLMGNVIATNLLPDASFETLTTNKMTIELDSKNFNSDVLVTLKGPQFVNTGQAMKGNLDDNTAVLFNHVKGIYEKAKP
ncbi:LPS export ABC transporter periplasmic protein LptC [Vibrio sp. UCD-FRSSP16_10]|uniref:LPS export ABC transporter periplasmic protein LptC n=1 Tax=unclassified Vibrio TaxID=2614977 RepID=UPI0007FEAA5E|nr:MULTISPECIES: LPS export ABC transporter periplasmic protein LptC [unclassified Vibrio]OBT17418.1 LPS export ABC transporter periplasmic protein LptC [Vibrio sp. UCD-FRSSP16_30]OBT23187.1 LPS export ABC transporter periplasmic protein LptC [Vibrio sp. UCD-FRSSP16_10]